MVCWGYNDVTELKWLNWKDPGFPLGPEGPVGPEYPGGPEFPW